LQKKKYYRTNFLNSNIKKLQRISFALYYNVQVVKKSIGKSLAKIAKRFLIGL